MILKNKDVLIEQNNKNLLAQINGLSYILPPKIQLFYQNFLNKNEQAESPTVQKEINSVISYEIVFLALQKRE